MTSEEARRILLREAEYNRPRIEQAIANRLAVQDAGVDGIGDVWFKLSGMPCKSWCIQENLAELVSVLIEDGVIHPDAEPEPVTLESLSARVAELETLAAKLEAAIPDRGPDAMVPRLKLVDGVAYCSTCQSSFKYGRDGITCPCCREAMRGASDAE